MGKHEFHNNSQQQHHDLDAKDETRGALQTQVIKINISNRGRRRLVSACGMAYTPDEDGHLASKNVEGGPRSGESFLQDPQLGSICRGRPSPSLSWSVVF